MLVEEVKSQLGKNGRKGQGKVAAEIATIKQAWLAEWTALLNSDEVPINTYRVIGELERHIDKENSIVTHDAGAPRDIIMPFFTATVPHSYIGWGKTTHLGYGIPLMIGAKLARPEKFCLNFMGDGAFGMSGLDIETAGRIGAPITTVLLNNGDMATYPGGYPVAREKFAVTRMTGDYAKIAEGLGAVGIVVKQPAEIAPALAQGSDPEQGGPARPHRRALQHGGPSFPLRPGRRRLEDGARSLDEPQAHEERPLDPFSSSPVSGHRGEPTGPGLSRA